MFPHYIQEAGHKPSTGRSVLGLVLLLVGLHRLEEAEKVAREFGNYCSLEQNLAIEQLLAGCEHGDPHMVRSCTVPRAVIIHGIAWCFFLGRQCPREQLHEQPR
jgi:hypothetical protein